MNKCLVTKILATINDKELPYFSELVFNVNSSNAPSGQTLRFEVAGSDIVVDTNGHPMADSTHLSSGTYVVKVRPKHNLTTLIWADGISINDMKDIQGCGQLNTLRIYENGKNNNINVFSTLTNLENITISSNGWVGNTSSLSGLTNIKQADFVFGSGVEGNVDFLKNMLKATSIQISGITGVQGDLKYVIAYWCENKEYKRTSCQFRGDNGSNITFNGSTFGSSTPLLYVPDENGCKVWLGSSLLGTYTVSNHSWAF